jgi:hypothetical protein
MASRLLKSDELTMTRLFFAPWRPLLDPDDWTVGWACDGHVHDGDDLLVVRGVARGRSYSVVAGDESLVGTMIRVRSDDGRRTWGLRLGDSDEVVAEYGDGAVRLTGPEGREVASIVGTLCFRFRPTKDWHLSFSSCENARLRLMSLWLLGRLARNGGGGGG